MSSSQPPVISFELGVGEFRIVTTEAVYQIKVCHDLMEAARHEAKLLPAQGTASKNTFYQNISEELFAKVGKLARKLSISVEELPDQLDPGNLNKTDQQLENVKNQLEEIVKITEEASMAIMDMADEIHEDMGHLKDQLSKLEDLDIFASQDAEADGGPQQEPASAAETAPMPAETAGKVQKLKSFIQMLIDRSSAPAAAALPLDELEKDVPVVPAPSPSPDLAAQAAVNSPETIMKKVTVTSFDLDVVFQTLYELCTNESVKDHIKQMRQLQNSDFRAGEIIQQLAELSSTVDTEDGFYNFPIASILKALYGATDSEDFKTILKKMNQTAASIFLDSVLPVEGQSKEIEIAEEVPAVQVEAAPQTPEEPLVEPPQTQQNSDFDLHISGTLCSAEDLDSLMSMANEIESLLSRQAGAPLAAGQTANTGSQCSSISTKDRDTLLQSVTTARQLIQKTGSHLTKILESLSFQDLSGQRIKKIVSLIDEVQIQLISILISADTKLKVHRESDGSKNILESPKTEALAQEEVDKAMEKLSGVSKLHGPDSEVKLDQNAVNDLLAQLGF